ncbi:acetate kinase [Luteibacter sp. Sphag1AF]|uniref:acetate/propionate family kinase n=1 Tax=Luteibacter sp. Sphag1AF TaxID=2587031 RepID=UPI00160EE007|nr:acetate kinase [Luteibacter sp. Sphag1AF]MBB3228337.1 acetate kinase [Luteibacter sp. Sphag1AF]
MSVRHVLALNSGSSSLKYGLYATDGASARALLSDQTDAPARGDDPLNTIIGALKEKALPAPDAIGHRIVHGGPSVRAHAVIDDALLVKLDEARAFAPLHVPQALAIVKRAREAFPDLPQVACFDTAFHASMPDVARILPLPADLRADGIEKYGFHGLSCEFIVRQLGDQLPSRTLIAHLGNGASITAVRDGRSIDTTMGLTPTGGIVMGTRPGDLDPGVLLYLLRERGYDADALERLVDRESGLAGLSGGSHDVRELRSSAAPQARLALEVFAYVAARHVAAMATALGGVDLLVFTGGIGEHDAATRDDISRRIAWMRSAASPLGIRVITTEEDEQIARHTWQLTRSATA